MLDVWLVCLFVLFWSRGDHAVQVVRTDVQG
jgi:hypothetical protein